MREIFTYGSVGERRVTGASTRMQLDLTILWNCSEMEQLTRRDYQRIVKLCPPPYIVLGICYQAEFGIFSSLLLCWTFKPRKIWTHCSAGRQYYRIIQAKVKCLIPIALLNCDVLQSASKFLLLSGFHQTTFKYPYFHTYLYKYLRKFLPIEPCY